MRSCISYRYIVCYFNSAWLIIYCICICHFITLFHYITLHFMTFHSIPFHFSLSHFLSWQLSLGLSLLLDMWLMVGDMIRWFHCVSQNQSLTSVLLCKTVIYLDSEKSLFFFPLYFSHIPGSVTPSMVFFNSDLPTFYHHFLLSTFIITSILVNNVICHVTLL